MEDESKFVKYYHQMIDVGKLANSSKSMIRKKRSSLARQIQKGNIKALKKAAKDRFYGSLQPDKREQICDLICEAKRELKAKVPQRTFREVVVSLIGTIVGIFNIIGGILYSILWIIRDRLIRYCCPKHIECWNAA